MVKAGPAAGWTDADLTSTIEANRAAGAAGLSTWVNLSAYGAIRPGGRREARLRDVVETLSTDPSGRSRLGVPRGLHARHSVGPRPRCRHEAIGDLRLHHDESVAERFDPAQQVQEHGDCDVVRQVRHHRPLRCAVQ